MKFFKRLRESNRLGVMLILLAGMIWCFMDILVKYMAITVIIFGILILALFLFVVARVIINERKQGYEKPIREKNTGLYIISFILFFGWAAIGFVRGREVTLYRNLDLLNNYLALTPQPADYAENSLLRQEVIIQIKDIEKIMPFLLIIWGISTLAFIVYVIVKTCKEVYGKSMSEEKQNKTESKKI